GGRALRQPRWRRATSDGVANHGGPQLERPRGPSGGRQPGPAHGRQAGGLGNGVWGRRGLCPRHRAVAGRCHGQGARGSDRNQRHDFPDGPVDRFDHGRSPARAEPHATDRGVPPRQSGCKVPACPEYVLARRAVLSSRRLGFGNDALQTGRGAGREHQTRLLTTLDEAVGRYPTDPEAWYELGDARMHWPLVGRTTPGQILEAFDRAIALDSAFGPAYIHPVEVALQLGRPAAARRYLAAYLALDQADMNSEGMGLVERLLARPPPSPAMVQGQIDTASS